MKNTKKCPKCGSTDIFVIDGFCGAYGRGNNIEVGMSIFSAVSVDRYVCGQCGYSEEWVRTEDIQKARNSRHAKELHDAD